MRRRLRRPVGWAFLGTLAACTAGLPPSVHAPYAPSRAVEPSGPTAPYLRPARTIDEYRLQVAARLMATNPQITYTTPAPDPLLAIPILEVEVDGDGSIRHIKVIRVPTQAQDTVQIALDALRRAAPFGDATHLPKPWKFTEVFLFDEDRHFKPRELD